MSLEELKKQIKIRAGHRGHAKKVLGNAEALSQEDEPDINKVELFKITLTEKLAILKEMDETILQSIDEDNIEMEIEQAGTFRERILGTLVKLNSILKKVETATAPPPVQGTSSVTVKTDTRLPKLIPKNFSGDPKVWSEWWDCYNAAVHENTQISKIEKFTHLRSLIEGAAYSTIAGLPPTAANYDVALNLLETRFAQKQTIINAHMSLF